MIALGSIIMGVILIYALVYVMLNQSLKQNFSG